MPAHLFGLPVPFMLQSDLTELVQHRQAELAAKHQALQVGAAGCCGPLPPAVGLCRLLDVRRSQCYQSRHFRNMQSP